MKIASGLLLFSSIEFMASASVFQYLRCTRCYTLALFDLPDWMKRRKTTGRKIITKERNDYVNKLRVEFILFFVGLYFLFKRNLAACSSASFKRGWITAKLTHDDVNPFPTALN